ncbi:hypothetical protein V8G54_019401, partial [Vigna mungo]
PNPFSQIFSFLLLPHLSPTQTPLLLLLFQFSRLPLSNPNIIFEVGLSPWLHLVHSTNPMKSGRQFSPMISFAFSDKRAPSKNRYFLSFLSIELSKVEIASDN